MPDAAPTEHLDVLILGAGLSGIAAARYLRTEHPARTIAVLEARGAVGGTWDLFRYPGVRSDSDLQTFGYEFKPWRDREAIATGPRILNYLQETVEENDLAPLIRFHHRVVSADWSSRDARWTVEVVHPETGQTHHLSATWLFNAGGYYRYDEGYTPHFEGRERFRGEIVHPQHWPDDLDTRGKRVVVIGSGATAVTLIPSLTETAAHVTMLQRTPTYVMALPSVDAVANRLQKIFGPERGYAMSRTLNVHKFRMFWRFLRRFPHQGRKVIGAVNRRLLPDGYPVDVHFNPPYEPWDQRLCLAPDGDFFAAISRGDAEVVTDRIASFTETGIQLESGEHLEADVVVTATGLRIQTFGGIELSLDGEPFDQRRAVAYRGVMLSGLPNFAFAIGYTNNSWTLKVGLLCEYFCRLLSHMDAHGYDVVVPVAEEGMETRPLLDFAAGYVQRAIDTLPLQGTEAPWLMSMDYIADRRTLRTGALVDEHLHFDGPALRRVATTPAQQR
ncbi:flavin-containing monooxygenase [Nocardioides gilvus]|uniref:flavin-containing monooxygenase n=1 Tax=Nocardioides gilvus TaxID=1735589 RepID=UPI000D743894|nr:NAD(P)/FAD-dependent oxidoreductase [Nocardioides gilvus]